MRHLKKKKAFEQKPIILKEVSLLSGITKLIRPTCCASPFQAEESEKTIRKEKRKKERGEVFRKKKKESGGLS